MDGVDILRLAAKATQRYPARVREDAMQEAALAAVAALKRFDPTVGTSEATWAYRSMLYALKDWSARELRRERPIVCEVPETIPAPDPIEALEALSLLATLPKALAHLLWLFASGRTMSEISVTFHIPGAEIREYVDMARAQLRPLLIR